MRRRLRFSVLALITLLLGGVAVLIGRTMIEQRKRTLIPDLLQMVPGVSQHIQDFRRVKVKDGRKVWEVSASDGQYYEEDKTVVVRGAVMEWYLEDGRTVGLRGDEGRIRLDGREVTRVDLQGGITVSLADYVVRTESATYDNDRHVISAPGAIAVNGKALQLNGDGLEIDVDGQRMTVLRNVSMRIEPDKRPGSEAPRQYGSGDVPIG